MPDQIHVMSLSNFSAGTGHTVVSVLALLANNGEYITADVEWDGPWDEEGWKVRATAALVAAALAQKNVEADTVTFLDNVPVPAGATGVSSIAIHSNGSAGRTLDSAGFQPSTATPVECSYTIRAEVAKATLGAAESVRVELRSDSNPTPTTVRDAFECSADGDVTAALSGVYTGTLRYTCPEGHYVRIVSAVVGSPTVTIDAQYEQRR